MTTLWYYYIPSFIFGKCEACIHLWLTMKEYSDEMLTEIVQEKTFRFAWQAGYLYILLLMVATLFWIWIFFPLITMQGWFQSFKNPFRQISMCFRRSLTQIALEIRRIMRGALYFVLQPGPCQISIVDFCKIYQCSVMQIVNPL